jgi:nuclear pore complex protein Nup85
MIHNLEMYPDVKGIFLQRLTFAVRYAEFHQFCMDGQLADAAYNLVGMFREGTAPKAWWGVLLLDSLDLLQNSRPFLTFHLVS